jgi:uncharacterized protein
VNRLADSSSAYLRQHAANPVDWWPWGNDALAEARRRNVPIFLSVGYAACHWCHVMAHESFESDDVAAFLNENFVAIKVDREERPYVDALSMAATQLISRHGGWPMSVFLLPDGRPFMAGTYYPPVDRGGQPGFLTLLTAMHRAWRDEPAMVERQADEVATALVREVRFIDHLAPTNDALDVRASAARLRRELAESLDGDGGFSGAPKFPRASYVDVLLDGNETERRAAEVTLDAMARRGLYDHVAGGFARYSVDAEWQVPHFEKMLSDQALLLRTYARAAAAWSRPDYQAVALDTANFVWREMRVAEGFASSLDADAGGVEGSHVVWSTDEARRVLLLAGVENIDGAMSRWSLTGPTNLEGAIIPTLAEGAPLPTPQSLEPAREALYLARSTRTAPGRDEKVILEWNAMFASALVSLGEPEWTSRAIALIDSLEDSHFSRGHWWRTEQREAHATAADVAWVIEANLDAYEATGTDRYRERASDVSHYLLAHYWDGDLPSVANPDVGSGFFTEADVVSDMPQRTKDLFDGATPAAHAVTTRALARLGLINGEPAWLVVAQRNVALAASLLAHHPRAVVDLVLASAFATDGRQIVIPGPAGALLDSLRSIPMSASVRIFGTGTNPLLADRREGWAYVCRGGVCALPVSSVSELVGQLSEVHRGDL